MSDLWWAIGLVGVLFILWLAAGGPRQETLAPTATTTPPATTRPAEITARRPVAPPPPAARPPAAPTPAPAPTPTTAATTSPWQGKVRLSPGNARFELQPNFEYLTIEAAFWRPEDEPVEITGWRLVNRRGETAVIPSAVEIFIAGRTVQPTAPVILPAGGRAVVITGRPPATNLFPTAASFRVNQCSGYLGRLPHYRFVPSLSSACPRPADEPGVEQLDDDCYRFVSRLAPCHTPEFERRADGLNYVDGQPDRLTTACRRFVQERFNYNGCVTWHAADQNFLTKEWRIYLNRSWQLWRDNREQIKLLDREGRLVAEVGY